MREKRLELLLNQLLILNKTISLPTIMITYKTELTLFLKLNNKIVITLMLKTHRIIIILHKDNKTKAREAIYSLRKLELELMPISSLLLETLETQYQRV